MSTVAPSPTDAARAVIEGIKKKGGRFVRCGDRVFVLSGGKRIEISPRFENYSYADLQIEFSGLAPVEPRGRGVCQRVCVLAGQAATDFRLVKFSALSSDHKRLYLPADKGELIQVSADRIAPVPNGDNADSVWVEHPCDRPFGFQPDCNLGEAFAHFERLCVETQASTTPEHAWLVAMHTGLLPYIRNYTRAKMLLEFLGASQKGKTSGAQRFTKLNGLGGVMGDVSAAYIRNNCEGLGLLVLDNKEHCNYTQELSDLLLFAATGARHGRSTQEGNAREITDCPVMVLTSIEGIFKPELQKRVLYIPYGGRLRDEHRDRDFIEDQIEIHRDEILSAFCHVFRRFLAMDSEEIRKRMDQFHRNSAPEFSGYFRTLARLLYAYATESGRPMEWADGLVSRWFQKLAERDERDDDVLESHVLSILDLYDAVSAKSTQFMITPEQTTLGKCLERVPRYSREGQTGTLYITNVGDLQRTMRLLKIGLDTLPRNAQGMSRRIESATWASLSILREDDDPKHLSRRGNRRRIGIFRPADLCDVPVELGDHPANVIDNYQPCSGLAAP